MSSIFVISKGRALRPNYLLLFLLCGDVNPNPSPTTKTQCSRCFRTIVKNRRFVECERCDLSFDIKFANVKPVDYIQLTQNTNDLFCFQFCLDNT